ncbi:hypothetical protein GHK92_16635 [Nocardioides sp. dk4132]|uniref:hypothetical protein n=1 Tax=unclassified Nocardioides TaxID=2615069 RepID=UPI0012978986|nr:MULTISPECIES: hypothetical protein [unclassified Nocardioides]MQW77501.1 hypothetical protein [Nocardioides sp. dk4132]QGA09299.1 hypothetical protein GFH29_19315 [Nocardioides sp. dk884]
MGEPKLEQAWDLATAQGRHRVEVRGTVNRQVTWLHDGVVVARKKSMDDKIRVKPGEGLDEDERTRLPEGLGMVGVLFTHLGRPRRATLYTAEEADGLTSLTGLGGIDLDPEPGSRAAAYEEKVLAHPRRYAAIQTAGGVATVLVPILVAALLARLALTVPWPDWDLPSIPWPDWSLPSIPWPDLPSIPWPDWSLPGWLAWVLDHASYVWPVVLAYVLARGEVRRRRHQAERRAVARASLEERPEESADDSTEGRPDQL